MRRVFASSVLVFMACLVPALAQTPDDRAALDAEISAFADATSRADYAGILDRMPPALIAYQAAQVGVSEAEMRAFSALMMRRLFDRVELEAFAFDTAEVSIETTSIGRLYALIPTTSVVRTDDQRFTTLTQTLALWDEGKWYLLRLGDERQFAMLDALYPDIAALDLRSQLTGGAPTPDSDT